MYELNTTPPVDAPERLPYETATKTGNVFVAAGIELDMAISNLRDKISDDPEMTAEDFGNAIETIYKFANNALNTLDPKSIETWNDYFRIVTHQFFVAESVLAPLIFASPDKHQARRELANGVYGKSVALIEMALNLHDDSRTSEDEKSELRGFINEQTFAASINRDQSAKYLALPASTHADLYQATDLVVFSAGGKSHKPSQIPLQIKSSVPRKNCTIPKNGFMLVASQFKNNAALTVSRSMVDELQPRELALADKNRLDYFNYHVKKRVHAQFDLDAGQELHVDKKFSGITTQVMDFVNAGLISDALSSSAA